MYQRFPHLVKKWLTVQYKLRSCSWGNLVTAKTQALCHLETIEGFVGEWTQSVCVPHVSPLPKKTAILALLDQE